MQNMSIIDLSTGERSEEGGWFPLLSAARANDASLIQSLIAKGADANQVVGPDGSQSTWFGQAVGTWPQYTALDVAVRLGNMSAVEALIEGNRPGSNAHVMPSREDDGLSTPSCIAAEFGFDAIVRLLARKGTDLNISTIGGWNEMFYAVGRNQPELVAFLAEHGADVNRIDWNDRTPAYYAAKYGRIGVLRVLYEKGADLDKTGPGSITNDRPVEVALESGHLETLRWLAAKGVDLAVSKLSLVHRAVSRADNDALRVLAEHGAPLDADLRSHVCHAVEKRFLEVLRVLAEYGADMNREEGGRSPAYIATKMEDISALRVLIEHGADLNRSSSSCYLVEVACDYNSLEVLQVLIDNKADLGSTANHAVQSGNMDALTLLLENGADSNRAGLDGRTPSWNAASTNRVDMLEVLAAHGADLNRSDWEGNSPAHIAAKKNYVDVLRFLNQKKARIHAYSQDEVAVRVHATPLLCAAIGSSRESFEYLARNGANLRRIFGGTKLRGIIPIAMHGIIKEVMCAGGWRKHIALQRLQWCRVRHTVSKFGSVLPEDTDERALHHFFLGGEDVQKWSTRVDGPVLLKAAPTDVFAVIMGFLVS